MNDFTDRLESWWEHAEQGIAHAGDTVIRREDTDGSYQVYTLEVGPIGKWADVRILHRAPAPKPAWHDAMAVIAWREGERQVFTPTVSGMWESEDFMLTPDEMTDPVPLIEQKVTEAMVKRAALSLEGAGWDTSDGGIALTDALNAALGITPA